MILPPRSWEQLLASDVAIYLIVAAFAALVGGLLCWPVRSLAWRFGVIDRPHGRHAHRAPTPRLGGLAVLGAVLAALPVGLLLLAGRHSEVLEQMPPLLPVFGIAIGVCVLGVCDDFAPLSPARKLLGLTAAGIALCLGGVEIQFLDLPGFGKVPLGMLAAPATVLWVLACTNAVNLIDGVDGLGAGVAAVACGTLAMVAHGMGEPTSAVAFLAVAGACGGFLLHNREPARIFLGDSGSLLLGFLLAAISANGCTKRATATFLFAGLLTLAVPLLDSTQAFVRRFRGAVVLGGGVAGLLQRLRATAVGDRGHIHHRLIGRGLSHRRVARVLCLGACVPASAALLLLPTSEVGGLTLCGTALACSLVLWRLASVPPAVPLQPPVETAEGTVVIPRAARHPKQPRRVDTPTELV